MVAKSGSSGLLPWRAAGQDEDKRMCGITGLVTNALSTNQVELDWLDRVSELVSGAPASEESVPVLKESLEILARRFGHLMSFGAYAEIATNPKVRRTALAVADAFDRHRDALVALSSQGRTDLDPLIEGLDDYRWQIREELVANADRVESLLPGKERNHRRRFVAWSIEQVLQSLDRLEVRGRDSAGIVVQLALEEGVGDAKLSSERNDPHAGHLAVFAGRTPGKPPVVSFLYKTASL